MKAGMRPPLTDVDTGLQRLGRWWLRVGQSGWQKAISLLVGPIYDQSATAIPNLQQRGERRVNKTTLASYSLGKHWENEGKIFRKSQYFKCSTKCEPASRPCPCWLFHQLVLQEISRSLQHGLALATGLCMAAAWHIKLIS